MVVFGVACELWLLAQHLFIEFSLCSLILSLDMLHNLFDWLEPVVYFLSQEFEFENLLQGDFYFCGGDVNILLLLARKFCLLDVISLSQQNIGWMQDDLLVQRVLLELLLG
jgi:hypothetical protein